MIWQLCLFDTSLSLKLKDKESSVILIKNVITFVTKNQSNNLNSVT